MILFQEISLREEILQAVDDLGFQHPTPIQEVSIPLLLEERKDLIGFAATGTGKTAAFSLPIIHFTDTKEHRVQAIILCPTRELCLQITNDIKDFTKYLPKIQTVAVYGGESIEKQIKLLKKGAHIVVGTPGRVSDMLRRKILEIEAVDWVVLDEADEMLSMGFLEEMEFILEYTPEERTTLMFSATMPREIEQIAHNYMKSPQKISVQRENTTSANVSHEYYVVKAKDKYTALRRIADMNPNIYAIVFCRTREDCKQIADKLIADGYNADALHGDLSQAQRDLVMHRFRTKHLQMLIATDVAARGIDVENLSHVINMELPDQIESYIHRSGRTGRAGNTGVSVTILHSRETKRISFLERKLGKKVEKKLVPGGREICEKQLFTLIDKIEKVQESSAEVNHFLPHILEKLQDLSKEDLIKNLVNLEFSQILAHYKSAEDINHHERDEKKGRSEERSGREGRDSRNGRDRWEDRPSRDRGDSRERNESREGRGERSSKSGRGSESGFTRFYLNIGKFQKVNPARVIDLLNSVRSLREARVGKILIDDQVTSFDIESGYEEDLMSGFRSRQVNGVHVELSTEKPAERRREKKEFKEREGRPFSEKKRDSGKSDSYGDRKKKKW